MIHDLCFANAIDDTKHQIALHYDYFVPANRFILCVRAAACIYYHHYYIAYQNDKQKQKKKHINV